MSPTRKLWRIVEEEALAAGLGIAPNCEALLRELVSKGEAGLRGTVRRRAEAEENLRWFVRAMIVEAKARNWTELHEDAFMEALKKLCPLWPFC